MGDSVLVRQRLILVASVLAIAMVANAPLSLATAKGTGHAPHVMRTAPPLHKTPLTLRGPGMASKAPGAAASNMNYNGGSIEQAPAVFLIFWGWSGGSNDPSGEAAYLQSFFNGVGGSSWINSQTQYYDNFRGFITNPTGQLLGVWFDDSTTPPVVIPDADIQAEALNGEAHFGYDQDADYIVATPTGHSTSGFGVQYCAWHSSASDGFGNPVAYTNFPYQTDAGASCGENFVNPGSAGLLDGVSIVGGHEYAEAMTDPNLDAWYDANGQETGDKCAWSPASADIALSTGSFAVQPLWSNAVSGCAMSG